MRQEHQVPMEEKLFKDFDGVSRDEWQNKIIADLKGKEIGSLNWEAAGLSGGPIYTKEDLPEQLPNIANVHDQPAIFGARNWVNYQLIDVDSDKTANQQALEALNAGADGVIFNLNTKPELTVLLADIKTDYCHISFTDQLEDSDLPDSFSGYLVSIQADLSKVKGYYSGSASVQKASGMLPHYQFFNIEADQYHNNPVQELALVLCKAAEVFDKQTGAGIQPKTLLTQTQFELSLGTSYFTEIAKYRAMRALGIRFANAYNINISACDLNVLARTGSWTEAIDDAHSYMLRATTEAMAAILGGTDALCIQPFYNVFEKQQKDLAERSARNISNVLKEESYFNKVVDPASGSYFVESLTREIMNKSWQLFLDMEAAGGYSSLSADKMESLYQNLIA
ncbi:MAG: hypothetical protein HEP71_09740 [Roseivirga sp.]|nr:hypothetical protein [Roseivirga sp.]